MIDFHRQNSHRTGSDEIIGNFYIFKFSKENHGDKKTHPNWEDSKGDLSLFLERGGIGN